MRLNELVSASPISRTETRLQIEWRIARAAWNGKAFVKVERGELVMYHDAFTYQVPTPYTLTFDDLMADDWMAV